MTRKGVGVKDGGDGVRGGWIAGIADWTSDRTSRNVVRFTTGVTVHLAWWLTNTSEYGTPPHG